MRGKASKEESINRVEGNRPTDALLYTFGGDTVLRCGIRRWPQAPVSKGLGWNLMSGIGRREFGSVGWSRAHPLVSPRQFPRVFFRPGKSRRKSCPLVFRQLFRPPRFHHSFFAPNVEKPTRLRPKYTACRRTVSQGGGVGLSADCANRAFAHAWATCLSGECILSSKGR